MHGDRHIAQHGFGTCRGDNHAYRLCVVQIYFPVFLERIENMPERSFLLYGYHFQIGNRGLQHRIPIYQPFAPIDEAIPIKQDESFSNGDQSQEAPSRRIWRLMVEPDSIFHCHTRSINASRPRSRRSIFC